MALEQWGFVFLARGAEPGGSRTVIEYDSSRTIMVAVGTPEEAVGVSRELVGEGVQLIELCGGFGPIHAARVIEAIDGAVPVGFVGYGPEAIDQLQAIFA